MGSPSSAPLKSGSSPAASADHCKGAKPSSQSQNSLPTGSSMDEPLEMSTASRDAVDKAVSSKLAAMGASTDAPPAEADAHLNVASTLPSSGVASAAPSDQSSAKPIVDMCPVTRSLRPKSACKPHTSLKCGTETFSSPKPGVNKRKFQQTRPIDTRFRKFEGVPISELIVIELCCGSAGYSAEISKQGFSAIAVDHAYNKHVPKHPVVSLDLSTPHGQQILKEAIEKPNVFSIGGGPPCGTASRAREKPLPTHLKERGFREPPPLRSAEHPLGLPGVLSGTYPYTNSDKDRVLAANSVYEFVSGLLLRAHELGILIWVENPKNSWMWHVPGFRQLLSSGGITFREWHNCMHGGKRKKWSGYATNIDEFSSLELSCDGSHQHAPWGVRDQSGALVFDSTSEAEYPQLLCSRMAKIMFDIAIGQGAVGPASSNDSADTERTLKRARTARATAANKQPRSPYAKSIVPEFQKILTTTVDLACATLEAYLRKEIPSSLCPGLPRPHKLLELRPQTRGTSDGGELPADSSPECKAVLGIYASPQDFVSIAVDCDHPFDSPTDSDDLLLGAIFEFLTEGPEAISAKRDELFRKYESLAEALQPAEDAIKDQLPSAKAAIIRHKRFLLLKRMASDAGYSDPSLSSAGLTGTKLTGMGDDVDEFPLKPAPPQISEKQVMLSTKFTRPQFTHLRSSGDDKLDRAVYDTTVEERARGWLDPGGPFTVESLQEKLGPHFVINKRFGIEQNNDYRAVDDYSASFVNKAYGSPFKLDLGGVDQILSVSKAMIQSVGDDRSVTITLSTGKVLKGSLHDSLSTDLARTLVGRTLDLSGAYRQLITSVASQWCSVIATFNPDTCNTELDIQHALPFGATAAVYGFNRFSRCIWHVGVALFRLIWFNFYDDYPQVDWALMGSASQRTAERLMSLLGWEVSMKENKRKPFCFLWDALGVTFDYAESVKGFLKVSNKRSRVTAIKTEIESVVEGSKALSPKLASSLIGKLNFTETQTFSRMGLLAVSELQKRSLQCHMSKSLSPSLKDELEWLVKRLVDAKPRVVDCYSRSSPVLLFTDGACEQDDLGNMFNRVTIGAVIIDSHDGFIEHFGLPVSRALIDYWKSDGTNQVITEAELLPILISKLHWKNRFKDRKVISFIDNDAVRHCLIKAGASKASLKEMLRCCVELDIGSNAWWWYSRVPSQSNIADDPSRLAFGQILSMGSRQVHPILPSSIAALLRSLGS